MAFLKLDIVDDLFESYRKVSKGSLFYCVVKIDDKYSKFIVECTKEQQHNDENGIEEIINLLPKLQPRYILMKFKYEIPDGKRSKTVLICWIPKKGKVKDKMIYASSLNYFKSKCHASVCIQSNDVSELGYDEIKKKCCRFAS